MSMPMRCLVAVSALFAALAWVSGCGGGGGGGGPLDALAGLYDLSEAYVNQTGNNCNTPPDSSVDNVMRVIIDGNEFEARFVDRWSTVKGEIHEDGGFLASGMLTSEQTVRFSGEIHEDGVLIATLEHVNGTACTRTFSVNGTQRP